MATGGSSPSTLNGETQSVEPKSNGPSTPAEPPNKTRRVRTGCLTCRERHLKCDEATPECNNCKKSSRQCRRGVRLNFIDNKIEDPYIVPPSRRWKVEFVDESRDIADEYYGGKREYAALDEQLAREKQREQQRQYQQQQNHIQYDQPGSLPPTHPVQYDHQPDLSASNQLTTDPHDHSRHHSLQTSNSYTNTPQSANFHHPETPSQMPQSGRKYLDQPDETLCLQVFVEEVGIWMDSMDPSKHFSRLIPFRAMEDPMLFNAVMACGARHLSLVNPETFKQDKASQYYETATSLLLNNLTNPARDTVACATTAVILNVYEIMTEKAKKRMMHIAGARALIKECGWNAKAPGIGGACFWLNIGMEVLSCLHFGWLMSWDPDDWGLDMDFNPADSIPGREELWTYRILYILGKLCNHKNSDARNSDLNPVQEQIRINTRVNEWRRLNDMAELWDSSVPRTMQPLAYLYPYQSPKKSAFPEVWLVKRTTIVARLFYHTAMCLLNETNPITPIDDPAITRDRLHHAHQVCGIVAHIHDRGVASVALRSMAVAAECLTNRREQQEVLDILTKTRQDTGWQINFLFEGLRKKWGWTDDPSHNHPQPPNGGVQSQHIHNLSASQLSSASTTLPFYSSAHSSTLAFSAGQQMSSISPGFAPPPTSQPPVRRLIHNPMYQSADFNVAGHPYQSHYVPPISQHGIHNLNFWMMGFQ